MRENHYAISCIILKISYVFSLQDEHNASDKFKMSWMAVANPVAKIRISREQMKIYFQFAER